MVEGLRRLGIQCGLSTRGAGIRWGAGGSREPLVDLGMQEAATRVAHYVGDSDGGARRDRLEEKALEALLTVQQQRTLYGGDVLPRELRGEMAQEGDVHGVWGMNEQEKRAHLCDVAGPWRSGVVRAPARCAAALERSRRWCQCPRVLRARSFD